MNRALSLSMSPAPAHPRAAVAVALGLLAAPSAASAQTYTAQVGARAYASAGGAAVGLSGQDDGTASVILPFDFPYFGDTYRAGSAVAVTSNGLLCLDAASLAYTNTALPDPATPNGMIAAYWTDLTVPASTDVYVRSSASELIVEWRDVQVLGREAYISMQVVLSPSGEVRLRYGPRSGSGRPATVGMESADGTRAVTLPCGSSCDFSSVGAGAEVVFQPGGGGGGGELSITTRSLPPAVLGAPYTAQLVADAPSAPSWRVVSGLLPDGLELFSSGRIGGTPSLAGRSSFEVEASAPGLEPARQPLELEVQEGGGILRLTSSMLPPGEAGVPYEAFITAAGGTPPYAYQIVEGLEAWMSLDPPTGRLSGTPPAAGTYRMRLSVFDSDLNDTEGEVVLPVGAARPLALVSALPEGRVGRAYDAVVVEGGVPPVAVEVAGALPEGLRVEGARLTGMPSAPFAGTLELSARDADGAEVSGALALVVTELTPLRILSERLSASINAEVSLELRGAGGLPPYTWSIVSGGLPPGLRLEGDRVVGRPASAGRADVRFAVVDAEGTRAEADVVISVEAFRSASGRNNRERGGGCAAAPTDGTALWLLGGLLLGWLRRRERPRGV